MDGLFDNITATFVQMAVTYDWRLAVPNLEIRDAYFTRLRNAIEQFRQIHNKKVTMPSFGFKVCIPQYRLKRQQVLLDDPLFMLEGFCRQIRLFQSYRSVMGLGSS